MSESVPSSITSFAHRRPRVGSTASFTYFHEEPENTQWQDDEAVVEDIETEDESTQSDVDIEYGKRSPVRRKSSAYSRTSLQDPLLLHRESTSSEKGRGGRTNQK